MFLVQNESKVGQMWTTNIYCTLFETEEASESGVSEMLEREEKRGRARDWSLYVEQMHMHCFSFGQPSIILFTLD